MKKTRIIVAVCALIFIIGTVLTAAAYDSSTDPVVTLSYLEKIFKPAVVEEVKSDETLKTSVAYTVEHLTIGESIEATGSCEVILRSGKALVVVTSEENIANKVGLSNITAGTELLNGAEVPTNNCLIIPRADGRGVVTISQDAYYMCRGDYKIVTAD